MYYFQLQFPMKMACGFVQKRNESEFFKIFLLKAENDDILI